MVTNGPPSRIRTISDQTKVADIGDSSPDPGVVGGKEFLDHQMELQSLERAPLGRQSASLLFGQAQHAGSGEWPRLVPPVTNLGI